MGDKFQKSQGGASSSSSGGAEAGERSEAMNGGWRGAPRADGAPLYDF